MPNECSPELANKVVALHKVIKHEDGGVAVVEPRIMVRRGVSRAALYLAHIDSLSQEIPVAPVLEPERPTKPIWSSALDFLVEGFANCGAPLYPPLAYLDAGGFLLEADAPLREAPAANERRVAMSLVPSAARMGADDHQVTNGVAMASVALPSQKIEPPKRWNWLTSCWEAVVTFLAHMRREREIRQAIDALAALDDFTLKDIGIHHRGQIEHAVRNANGH
ncbi:uncharacterized protein YjiS (DUF1127 family) [Nitrobacteraceae bacterium AZCC 1564]